MRAVDGKVAVITGGSGGLGRALGRTFGRAGMKVVLADVQPEPLAAAEAELRAAGIDAAGVVTNVADPASVDALRDATVERFGGAHVLCNNAGIGAGAEGRMWDHELNDWRWAIAVNVMGVVHGINSFVPVMLAQAERGEEGHVVNTSSGNGAISPLPSTPQYSATKAAVVTISECLYGQLQEVGAPIGVSLLLPGPHMMRTGLFESWRSRLDEFAKQRPRQTPYTTVEALEAQMRAAGIEPQYTDPAEVADGVLAAILAGQFWIHPPSERSDQQLDARTASIRARTNPDYLRPVPG